MHTEPPPHDLLEKWLNVHATVEGRYGHTLLEDTGLGTVEAVSALRAYFESAHVDARQHFHDFVGMSLHPDDGARGSNAKYPNCLPPKSHRGLFGEVLSGLFTEALPFIGRHEWLVPVFLFRNHEDVQQYLYTLARNPERKREVIGRKGDDFIGLVVNEDGNVTRFIAGEAKWRKTWTPSKLDEVMLGKKVAVDDGSDDKVHDGKGVWFEINRALNVPIGLKQMQDLLQDLAPDEYQGVILSLDRVLQLENADPVERTDLIVLSGGGAAKREVGESLLEWQAVPKEYTAGRDLQVVELILKDGDNLIDSLYKTLWT
ncbi:aminotransferase [Rhizobium ruizarguesonis]|uniref:aminotransferase n=1 Tax=Rhizobium ruizarguesonis TaxID=2081791 RepID=UPI0010312146|nr:aminotransferase [Rhizobium ruizarguesonis]TBE77260.1 aminotransferase [Rhizobium ruizarguesonis]